MDLSAIALTAVGCAAIVSCGGSGSDGVPADLTAPSGDVVVFAAASLTEAFDEIARAFEATEPDIDVQLSFAGTSSLAVAIEEGAPADVLASANTELVDRLASNGMITAEPRRFATNAVAVAIPTGSDRVTSLRDFERGELFLGACAAQVPCGVYADELFEAAGVSPELDTRAADVRALVSLLIEGELDAGIVYGTDIRAHSDRLTSVALDVEEPVVASYPIAILDEAPNPAAAQRFVDFVLEPVAQEILGDAGFGVL